MPCFRFVFAREKNHPDKKHGGPRPGQLCFQWSNVNSVSWKSGTGSCSQRLLKQLVTIWLLSWSKTCSRSEPGFRRRRRKLLSRCLMQSTCGIGRSYLVYSLISILRNFALSTVMLILAHICKTATSTFLPCKLYLESTSCHISNSWIPRTGQEWCQNFMEQKCKLVAVDSNLTSALSTFGKFTSAINHSISGRL